MVGAFPETGFIVGAVGCSVGKDGPVPLSMLMIYQMVNDEIPCCIS